MLQADHADLTGNQRKVVPPIAGRCPGEATRENFDRVFAINAKAVHFVTQLGLTRLRDGGRIINVSSMLSRGQAMPNTSTYAMSKGAVDSLTIVLAKELAPRRITVNTVSPGVIDTEIHEGRLVGPALDWVASLSSMGRIGTPDDVADAVAFLASEDSRWITGHWLDASGGSLL